jgi:hypothetical protein
MNITYKVEHTKVITYNLDNYELHQAVAEYIMERSNQHGIILAEDVTIKDIPRAGDFTATAVLTAKVKEGESL